MLTTIEVNESDHLFSLQGWLRLAVGIGLIWIATYIVLPWCQTLPYIRPVMQVIKESDIHTTAYWYTQLEETAIGQMYVQHSIQRGK